MNVDRLKEIFQSHGKWLRDEVGERANLRRANLFWADLRGTKLTEKIIQVGPIGSRLDYTIFFVDQDVVQCGCWNECQGGSLDEFKKRVDKAYPANEEETLMYRNEYLSAIAMFERLRDDARQPL
ncbi:MAG: pentapeptide repeat-containing protein [Schwartzia sp. (in: firmicutes)]